eukprot:GHVL01027900.1.p1 GENE.GHVL01027900.1~~GHVL01027900.1.p1  ORF type:complete len:321 (+),score=40.75 GHVL01027900.1:69-1031(+)
MWRYTPQLFFFAFICRPQNFRNVTSVAAEKIESLDNIQTPRIFCLPDVHGDFAIMMALLRTAKVIDKDGHWIAGISTLIQLGDLVDRGPFSKEVLDFMMALRTDASNKGGRVINLLGNHEQITLFDDERYVHPEEFVRFGGREARRKAFSRDGKYGPFVRSFGAVAKINNIIFTHAGILPEMAQYGVDSLNEQMREATLLSQFNDISPIMNILWDRELATKNKNHACNLLAASLAHLKADRMIVGHTVQLSFRMRPKCDGRLILADTGLSRWMGGAPSLLIMDSLSEKVLYLENAGESKMQPKLISLNMHKENDMLDEYM